MIENVVLLLSLIGATFLWIYDAIFSAGVEKEDRRFWMKATAICSVLLAVFFWFILRYWVPN
jgi:hypothetical protein